MTLALLIIPHSPTDIDLLTRRVWMILIFRTVTATAETAARNFVSSVLHDVGLPDFFVSDIDTRFIRAFWKGLHAALGASLIFGSLHH